MKYAETTCVICGKTFMPIAFGQKCCSKECSKENKSWHNKKQASSTELLMKECKSCGEKFMPSHYRQLYCCEKCKFAYESKVRKERKKENKEVKHINMEEKYRKKLAEDPFMPLPKKCPGLPWYRCNKMLSPYYPKYRCPSCDKKWRIRYNLPLYEDGEE